MTSIILLPIIPMEMLLHWEIISLSQLLVMDIQMVLAKTTNIAMHITNL